MIYSPELSEKILAAMERVSLSNNGWAWIQDDAELVKGLQLAGYVVIETGTGTKAFSRAAQEALAEDYKQHGSASFAVPARATHKPAREDGPDYEAMILARQERWMMDY